MTTTTLDHLNAAAPGAFVEALEGVFEHAPWVAEQAATLRPFPTVTALHGAMLAIVRAAPLDARSAFLRAHPELGGKVARGGDMTAESVAEQGSLGLNRLSDGEFARFEALNAAYGAKFGFPFIICVRRQTRDAILSAFARRTSLSVEAEMAAALDEIGHITRLRIVDRVSGEGMPKVDGRLSTHVLDTLSGKPAPGVRISLYEIDESARGLICVTVTNADGRTDKPLMGGPGGGPLRTGRYELVFEI
ncbi:MAG: 2-oxo-4-hydroxy-4-carboxy-5-ureidoimidazoline decarboxylase, partial [Beijerinckiaceae bacterium]